MGNRSPRTESDVRAIVYCRISSDPTREAHGVNRQVKDCRRIAKDAGWSIVWEAIENDAGASRYSKSARPVWADVLRRLEAGEADALIAWDLDRLTRQPRELESLIDLADSGLKVRTATGEVRLDTTDGRAMARILMSIRAAEVDQMKKRQTDKCRHDAMAGRVRTPIRTFGYSDDKKTAHPVEADVVRQMVARVIDGESCASVARWLNLEGHRTVKRTTFQSSSVKFIVENPRIAGLRAYRGEVLENVKGEQDALVSVADWRKACARLARLSTGRRGGSRSLLTNLVVCGRCGQTMYRSGPHESGVLKCVMRNDHGCALAVNALRTERLVAESVIVALGERETRRRLVPTAKPMKREDPAAIQRLIAVLAQDVADGTLAVADYDRLKAPLVERLNQARKVTGSDLPADRRALALVEAGTSTLRAEWDSLDLDTRRILVGYVVRRIVVAPGVKSGKWDPARIRIEWKA